MIMNFILHRDYYKIIDILLAISLCLITLNVQANSVNYPQEGMANLSGTVISTPCSIAMSNQLQLIDFSSLRLPLMSSKAFLDEKMKFFTIELINCGNLFNLTDSKTWSIRFDGEKPSSLDSFLLQGPSKGLSVYLYNEQKELVYPNKYYPISKSLLKVGESYPQLYLRYFLKLGLTGNTIQAGDYYGVIRFFIDYQ